MGNNFFCRTYSKAVFFSTLLFFFISHNLFSQRVVRGKITGRDGIALFGATIAVKGTKNISTTDSSGLFIIRADPGNMLKFSFVGYLDYQLVLGNETELHISLTDTIINLNDIVVIGYGTARKKDLTGAIASVSEKNFNKGIYSSPDQLIQGKVSGVEIKNNTGSPGGTFTILIRGNSAITGTGQPLYVVDGVPLDGRSLQEGNNPLNFLNTNDIASVDILKDASATAIYGSRAAYGVVIINTKKGQAGIPKLEVNISTGVSSILRKVRVLNSTEYREAINYYSVDTSFDKKSNSDGLNAILRNGIQQNYSIAASGGNDNGKYRISVGYLNQEGIVINTGFKKYNTDITTGLLFLSSKKLGIDFHINSSQYIQNGSSLNDNNGGIVRNALNWNPTAAIRNADGSLRLEPSEGLNPVAFSDYYKDNLKVFTLLSSISPYYKITNWLDYKFLLSYNYNSGISRFSINQAMNVFPFQPSGGFAFIKNYELNTLQATHTLNFNKEILKGLSLNAVAGYEYIKFTNKGFSLSGNGAQNGGFGNYGMKLPAASCGVS
jgi:iron complex outermembrane receptor protein